MFRLKDRVVYVISPEKWGHMKISKHHYAMALADSGNRVYFIEPPSLSFKGIEIHDCKDHRGIRIVRYKPVFRGKRYLPGFIYSLLQGIQIRLLRRRIGEDPDLVLCFQGFLFGDLRRFKAPINVFFAADLFGHVTLPSELETASFSLAVSGTIQRRISEGGHRVHPINHGISKVFADHALERLRSRDATPPGGKLTVGYAGNLMKEDVDRATMTTVIEKHSDIDFVFWGSYSSDEMNLGGVHTEESQAFIRFLKQRSNVRLRGSLETGLLQQEMRTADMFWMCQRIDSHPLWDGSNSHKILEYLSYGKPVVSHHVSDYRGKGLIYMLDTADNAGYPDLFEKVRRIAEKGENRSLIENRLNEAISNTYSRQVEHIESLIRETLEVAQTKKKWFRTSS